MPQHYKPFELRGEEQDRISRQIRDAEDEVDRELDAWESRRRAEHREEESAQQELAELTTGARSRVDDLDNADRSPRDNISPSEAVRDPDATTNGRSTRSTPEPLPESLSNGPSLPISELDNGKEAADDGGEVVDDGEDTVIY